MRLPPLLALLLTLPASAAEQGGFGGAEGLDLNAAKAISGRAPADAGRERSPTSNQSVRGRLERGCLAHQEAVYAPARAAAGPSLTVSGIRYGLFPQHNAVIVFPNGTDWRYTGIVLDGWKCQSSELPKMIYLYENWGGARPVELFGREWEINPNPGSAMPRLVSVP